MIQARVSRFFTKEKTDCFFHGWLNGLGKKRLKQNRKICMFETLKLPKMFKTSWCDNSAYGTDNYQTSFTPFIPHHIWYIYIYMTLSVIHGSLFTLKL